MNKYRKNQIKMLQELYDAGKFADIPMKMIQAMSYEELENFILLKQRIPAGTIEPMMENYRKALLEMIDAGNLCIAKNDLNFMSQRKAEKFYWMGRNSIADKITMCNKEQYKRLRSMRKEGIISYMTDEQIGNLTARAAELLLAEGEENILNLKGRIESSSP